MKNVLPIQISKVTTSEIINYLTNSAQLSAILIFANDGNSIKTCSVAKEINKTPPQVYHLCERLVMYGLLRKVAGKGIFIKNNTEFDQETWQHFIDVAVQTVKEAGAL